MTVRSKMRVAILLSVALCCGGISAQTPAPSPGKPAPPRAGRAGEKAPPAPQVVTIIHRLNGLKMFRLLARSQEQVQAISSLDWSFNLMDDVHTNVIAGLALDDGETIAAWLPEAEVEFGPGDRRFTSRCGSGTGSVRTPCSTKATDRCVLHDAQHIL